MASIRLYLIGSWHSALDLHEPKLAVHEEEPVHDALGSVQAIVSWPRREEELLVDHGLIPRLLSRQPRRHPVQELWHRGPKVEQARVKHPDPHCVRVARPAHLWIVEHVVVSIGGGVGVAVGHGLHVAVALQELERVMEVEQDAVSQHEELSQDVKLCSSEDVELANVLLKPNPLLPPSEIGVEHTKEKYGSVPRYYIKGMLPVAMQARLSLGKQSPQRCSRACI
ncbi:hypothetical protein SELMODRAFT_412337 [Selaginella moellendorffii]|uniref:Uncharacterized protein n=1 Tax=Selaginella moellendorffii TaxID=88036 RepID=D8RKU1_SELML|nr:hypothetical protein SELMODRAFT_412337 [Selaginella moellendorffii]